MPSHGGGAWSGLGGGGGAHTASACFLQNVSFSLSPGKVTALVGPSGSGKSSCVNILENFYPLEGGRVLLDGQPISAYDHKFLHRVVRGALCCAPPPSLRLSFSPVSCHTSPWHTCAMPRIITSVTPPRSRNRTFQHSTSPPRCNISPDFEAHHFLAILSSSRLCAAPGFELLAARTPAVRLCLASATRHCLWFIRFRCWMITRCVNMSQPTSSFCSSWAFGLFPGFHCCPQCRHDSFVRISWSTRVWPVSVDAQPPL